MANLTGKTIGELALLTGITTDTLFAVELSGATYHIPYSGLSIGGGGSYENVTYDELYSMFTGGTLTPGGYYLITDFRTCYDRPDYDQFKNPIPVSGYSYFQGAIEPILVLATSTNTLSIDAYQPTYQNDKIKYDITYTNTESGGVAYGRITERIDEYNNRTDYDHRNVVFKRYRYYYYEKRFPQTGTVELLNDGTVNGTNTLFNSLFVGDVIAIPNSNEVFYRIVNIDSDTLMTVSGNTINPFGGGGHEFFTTNVNQYDSYYQNNVDSFNDFILYTTFGDALSNNGAFNNYIGNHSNGFIYDGIGDFLLANNVFKSGIYYGNKIGDSSYNNTFNDDCTNNTIGNFFDNNITDDDFDGNIIGNNFRNNLITANFQYNQVGENFQFNTLLNGSFYRNQIGNDFNGNWLDPNIGDFQNNVIGNQFNDNILYNEFYKNHIRNGYGKNTHYGRVYGNLIGNGFNQNTFYYELYENRIGEIFANNTLGDSQNIGSGGFYDNTIGNDFQSNTCTGTTFYSNNISHNFINNVIGTEFVYNTIDYGFQFNIIQPFFGYNKIGNFFNGNTIGEGFGYGGGIPRGNTIGNSFSNNTIGEYFYDNTIVDQFQSNIIGNDFKYNQVLNTLVGTNFTSATHVYASYNCRLLLSNDSNYYLEYLNVTTPTYVSITS